MQQETWQKSLMCQVKAYEVIKNFEDKKYIKKSRIVGKTQLYLLNKENPRIKLFLKTFNECLRIIAEEHSEKELIVAKAFTKRKA